MDIIPLASILLVGRLISDTFIIVVIVRQLRITRELKKKNIKTHPRLQKMRTVLSMLAIAVFIGNIYPLVLDLVTLFNPAIRTSQHVNLQGVFYTIDNNFTFMFASILIWCLYKLADIAIDVGELVAGDPPTPVEITKRIS